jgi:hypothetical protein
MDEILRLRLRTLRGFFTLLRFLHNDSTDDRNWISTTRKSVSRLRFALD